MFSTPLQSKFYAEKVKRDIFATVKAPKFRPPGNLGPFLASSASLGQLCTKNEQNRIGKS
jgi:hypothetical protein